MKTFSRIAIFVLISALLAGNIFFIVHDGYFDKFLYRYCGKERSNVSSDDESLIGWQESLSQLNYDADIAFFGDSITAAGKWQEWFPDYKIINLGVSANSPEDMNERIGMVYSVHPEKVFIMGGINGITRVTIKPYVERYSSIIENLQKNLPDVQIFIQSVLPISPEKGRKNNITNEVICNFNNELMKIAEKQGCVYIDLYSLYEKDGIMNPELTTDGVHLTNDAYLYWINAIRPYIEE